MPKRRGYGLRKQMMDIGVGRHHTAHLFRPRLSLAASGHVVTDARDLIAVRTNWLAHSLLYLVAGLVSQGPQILPVFQYPTEVENLPIGITVAALALSLLWAVFAYFEIPVMPWNHVAVSLGTLIITYALLSTGYVAPSLLAFFVLTTTTAAFMLPAREAMPHLALILACTIVVGLSNNQSDYAAIQTVCAMMAIVVTAFAMTASRRQLENGVKQNVELAGSDPLTGTANVRRFNERLEAEISRSARLGAPITLFMVDLDEFKQINDRFSHTLGDAVLIACANAVGKVVRPDELVARRGGDEFAVIAIDQTESQAHDMSERIRVAVRRERTKLCPDVTPEGSVGYAIWRPGELPADLLRRADEELHLSKLINRDSAAATG